MSFRAAAPSTAQLSAASGTAAFSRLLEPFRSPRVRRKAGARSSARSRVFGGTKDGNVVSPFPRVISRRLDGDERAVLQLTDAFDAASPSCR